MVRNVMSAFDVPPKEHYWAHTCCVDVQNIASSKNINGRYPLEMSEGNTRTFQESDLIWGSLFDMLISVRLHKTIGNQKYRWEFYTHLHLHLHLNIHVYHLEKESKNGTSLKY